MISRPGGQTATWQQESAVPSRERCSEPSKSAQVRRSLFFSNAQTPPRVGTQLFRACGSSCNFLKREALVVKGRGTEFCRRAARLRRPRHRCVSSRKVRGSFAHRSTRNACWALMRCRSRNSLGFDLISLAFFGPLFMAPGRFRPFPLPLLACPGRAKNRRGAGLVRSGARWHSQGSTT